MRDVLNALSSVARCILVHGPAGSGKSTSLMMGALEYATANPEVLVLWYEKVGEFPSGLVRALDEAFNGNIMLIIDDCSKVGEGVGQLLSEGRLSRTRVMLCERTNIWRGARIDVGEIDRTIRVARIDRSDVGAILGKLEEHGPWGYLGSLTPELRARLIYEKAQRQLLVGLREATSGMGYDKILASEYQSVPPGYAFEAANIVAMASAHRLVLSERTFRMAIEARGFSQSDVPQDLTEGLEEIVFLERGCLRLRHPIIAEYLVRNVVADEDALAAVKAMLHALSRFGSPLRRTARGPEAQLFTALTNHGFLLRRFGRHRADILELYDRLGEKFGDDALFLMQQALFEESCGGTRFESAINHIREALAIWPESFQILNAYANIHFSAAMHVGEPTQALSIMEDASEVLEDQCKDPRTEAYALVGLARGRIKVLQRWWPTKVAEEWKVLARRLREAQVRHGGDPEIGRALYEVPLLIAKARAVVKGQTSKSRGRSRKAGRARGRTVAL